MKWLLSLLLVTVLGAAAQAQTLNPICPDRPGKGTSACTVAPDHFQIELGLDDLSVQRRGGLTTRINDAGGLLAKFGLTPAMDIEAGINLYQSERDHGGGVTTTESGMGDLFLHLKYDTGGVQGVAIVLDPYLKLPTAASAVGNGRLEGGLVLPMSYDLGEGWSLANTPEADALANGAGPGAHGNVSDALGLSKNFAGGITLGAEIWTDQNFDPTGTSSEYTIDLVAADLLDNDTQLDCGINFGLNRQTPNLEVYAGVAERF